MYGDMGHGFLLFLFGFYLTYCYKSLKSMKDFKDILEVRYLILLMGFFAFYCGFVYNDFSSLAMNFFGSCYNPYDYQLDNQGKMIVQKDDKCVYAFGNHFFKKLYLFIF